MKLNLKQISKIKQKIDLDNSKAIIRVDVSHKNEGWSIQESNFNIYCIDQQYKIIWQVKEGKPKPASILREADPFYYLSKNNKGEVIADRFSGFIYKIDPETGEATQIGFHK